MYIYMSFPSRSGIVSCNFPQSPVARATATRDPLEACIELVDYNTATSTSISEVSDTTELLELHLGGHTGRVTIERRQVVWVLRTLHQLYV